MSFIGDIFGGKANTFTAKAPVNEFQAHEAKLNQQNYSPQIQQAGQNYQDIFGQQQQSNQALRDIANGVGPNPALAQLSQTTGQNINAAAGQAASARGANPALKARLATDAAAGANSAASGQAATLAAQQQLGAQQMLAQNLQGQGNQSIGLLGTSGQLQQGQNALDLQNSLATQQMNAAVAAQNAGLDLGAQQINAGVAAQNAATNTQLFGGAMNAIGGALALVAQGGEVPSGAEAAAGKGARGPKGRGPVHLYLDGLQELHGPQKMANGGWPVAEPGTDDPWVSGPGAMGPFVGADAAAVPAMPYGEPAPLPGRPEQNYPQGPFGPSPAVKNQQPSTKQAAGKGMQTFSQGLGTGLGAGSMDAYDRMERRPVYGALFAQGGRAMPFAGPGPVPGQPQVPGVDTEANDRVPALLTPKEIVLPLSVTQAADAPEKAKKFVEHLTRRRSASGYDKVAKARGGKKG